MSTLSSVAQERGFRSQISRSGLAYRARPSRGSNEPPAISESVQSSELLTLSVRQYRICFSLHTRTIQARMNWRCALKPTTIRLSTRTRSSARLTSPPVDPPKPPNAIARPGDQPWSVKFHNQVAKTIALHGGVDSPTFRPSIGQLVRDLQTNPKQFPKKSGKLKTARAAPVSFADGIVWRAVYTLDEAARSVRVIALGPHDDAYADASKRI